MWSQEQTPCGPVSYYRQRTTTTCNIACGMMMLKALKGNQVDEGTMIAAVSRHLSPDARRLAAPGYTLEQVVGALTEKWRLQLRTQTMSPAIMRMASVGKPAIGAVENARFAHAVMICGPADYGSFLVLDPQFGVGVVPFDSYPTYPLPGLGRGIRFGSQIVTSW